MPRTETCLPFWLGPLVGVRKAGLVSVCRTSACASLDAVLFWGVTSVGNPSDCPADNDDCPLDHCGRKNGDHVVSSEGVYQLLYCNEIHPRWCRRAGINRHPIQTVLFSRTTRFGTFSCCSNILCGTLVLGKPLHDRSASAIFLSPFRGFLWSTAFAEGE